MYYLVRNDNELQIWESEPDVETIVHYLRTLDGHQKNTQNFSTKVDTTIAHIRKGIICFNTDQEELICDAMLAVL